MKTWLAALLLVWSTWLPAWAAGAGEVHLSTRQTITLDFPGAMAAFAVDPSLVEVSTQAGQVVLVGLRTGQTIVTLVLHGGIESLHVHVEPAAAIAGTLLAARDQEGRGFVETRYDSGMRSFTGTFSGNLRHGEREIRLRFEAVRRMARQAQDGSTALPVASVEIETPTRSVVLLDKLVRASPLTVDGVVLRGIHWREGAIDVHAGIASWSPLDGFLVPSSGDRAALLSWTANVGTLRLIPSVTWLPDSGARVPAVAAVAVESGKEADALRWHAEIGVSGRPGAAVDVDYRTPERQLWLRGMARPAQFAALRQGRPAGTHVEGAWLERLGEDMTASVSGSASRLDLAESDPKAVAGRAELRHQLTTHWSATAAVGGGAYRTGDADALRRGTVSVGTSWEGANLGVNAQYRRQSTSQGGDAGHGGRISIRSQGTGWRATGFIDAQQQAPTMDLVLRDRSEITRAVAELGITAAQPEEVVRQLHDNAALLAANGLAVGPVRLNPLRRQAAVDVSWRGSGPARPEMGLRLLQDKVQGVVGSRQSVVASLYGSWRVTGSTDVGMSYSRWAVRQDGSERLASNSFQFWLRTQLDHLALPGESSRPITGQIFRDDQPDGGIPQAGVPLAGVEVVLDRSRRTHSDAQGRYQFERPGAGAHRVEAILPQQPGAYFTTTSVVTRQAGDVANFNLSFAGARLSGMVRDDAGLPMGGVTVRLEGTSTATAVTDSAGVYRLALPPGDVRAFVVRETVPPGYDLGALAPQPHRLLLDAPAVVNFTIRAQRSIEGVVAGTDGKPVSVSVPELSRSVRTDPAGRFILRGLPSGALAVVVTGSRGERRSILEVPPGPGVMRGVQLAAP